MAEVGVVKVKIPAPNLKDVPAVSGSVDPAIRAPLQRLTELTQALAGLRGDDRLDMAITYRHALQLGLITSDGLLGIGGAGGTPMPGPVGPPGPPAPGTAPDLTPPPNVTGLGASAGLTQIIITWDAAVYTEGHGHEQTNIYAVKKDASDPTLPTFGDAALVASATGALTILALVSDLSIRWHIWAKYQTKDGIESSAPAGGTNGVVAQTGKIGNADLGPLIVEAQNIADKAVDSSKMTVNDFSTIADNPTFEAGDIGWLKESNWTIVNDPANALNGSWVAKHTGGVAAALRNVIRLPVIQGDEFYAEARIKTPGMTIGTGGWVRLSGRNAAGAEIWTPSGNVIAGSAYGVSAISATVPVNVVSVNVELVALNTDGIVFADNVRFQRKLTLNHLAAGSIAVGTAAIANGAIINAMIGTAAIDDAKVANLSAAKLTVGDGTVGGNLKSAGFVDNVTGWIVRPDGSAQFAFAHIRGTLQATQVSANFITAGMIDSRNLTIKDAAGNIILSASQNLDWARIAGSGRPADNATVGATFGVNINGQITPGNVTTYIAAAAIGAAQVGVLNANNLTVSALSSTINGGAGSGQRVEVQTNKVLVYDSSNVLRVKLGDLS